MYNITTSALMGQGNPLGPLGLDLPGSSWLPGTGWGIQFEVFDMDSNEKALSVKEVAAELGCSRDTVRRGIESGKIRAF